MITFLLWAYAIMGMFMLISLIILVIIHQDTRQHLLRIEDRMRDIQRTQKEINARV